MKMKEFLKKTKQYNEKINDFKEKINSLMKSELTNVMKDFFEENPEIQCICWTQYTPHFNDGEPCVFGINEPQFITKGFDAKDLKTPYDYEDDGEYDCVQTYVGDYYKERAAIYEKTKNPDDEYCYNKVQAFNKQRKDLAKACHDFSKFVSENEKAFENMFGDGVAVYLVPNEEPIVEYYDHD